MYWFKFSILLLVCCAAVAYADRYTALGAGVISIAFAAVGIVYSVKLVAKDGPEGFIFFPHIVICMLGFVSIWAYYFYSNWGSTNLMQIFKAAPLFK